MIEFVVTKTGIATVVASESLRCKSAGVRLEVQLNCSRATGESIPSISRTSGKHTNLKIDEIWHLAVTRELEEMKSSIRVA